jgi:hypothetical protein
MAGYLVRHGVTVELKAHHQRASGKPGLQKRDSGR